MMPASGTVRCRPPARQEIVNAVAYDAGMPVSLIRAPLPALLPSALVVAAAAIAVLGWVDERPLPSPFAQPDQAARKAAYAHCSEGAVLFHDVRWAAACMVLAERHAACLRDDAVRSNAQLGSDYCERTFGSGDGMPECELPQEAAAALNGLLRQADRQCLAELGGATGP